LRHNLIKSALGEALAVHGFGGKNHLLLINAASFKGPSVRVALLGGRNTLGKLSEFVATAKTGVIMVDEVEKGDSQSSRSVCGDAGMRLCVGETDRD
jgi:hypothetical protein